MIGSNPGYLLKSFLLYKQAKNPTYCAPAVPMAIPRFLTTDLTLRIRFENHEAKSFWPRIHEGAPRSHCDQLRMKVGEGASPEKIQDEMPWLTCHPKKQNRTLIWAHKIVFCYQNCSDLLWDKIVLVIEKNFWNSRLKAENLQKFWEFVWTVKGQNNFW